MGSEMCIRDRCLQSILLYDIIVQIVVHLLFISVHNNQILVHISIFFGTREHFLVHFLVHGRSRIVHGLYVVRLYTDCIFETRIVRGSVHGIYMVLYRA